MLAAADAATGETIHSSSFWMCFDDDDDDDNDDVL